MKLTLIRFLLLVALVATLPLSASASDNRTPPVWGKWSVGCGNSGLCYASSFTREQSTWLDMRIVRDWHATSGPLLRLTANAPLNNERKITIDVDGTPIDSLPVAQLREIQGSVATPPGFRPVGGEGFWLPTGPLTDEIVQAMVVGSVMTVTLPIGTDDVRVRVLLDGMRLALDWLDDRQQRSGTVSAIVNTGTEPAVDAPHAQPILNPETLPPALKSAWDANRFCSDIDPAIFAGLDAVAAPLADKSTLYLLPCGAPSAYNTPYVVILSLDGDKTRQVHLARMSEHGPVATDLVYNARWNPGTLELIGLFKGSGVGDCGRWSRWAWTGTGFALREQATRQTCDGKDVPISDWTTIWPHATAAQ
ncbi:DUF1176 domain-containing protein [Roseibium sp.]|uniref:DUF1176 domain-containing protein n=1 Tax=Roseibium sp. TaxID=1936156 RepID=UPI003A97EF81